MQSVTLSSTLSALKVIKRRAHLANTLLCCLRAAAMAAAALSIWSLVSPTAEFEQLALGTLAFVVTIVSDIRKGRHSAHTIALGDLALSLEMKHATTTQTPLSMQLPDNELPTEWRQPVAKEVAELKDFEWARNLALASTLLLPLALSFITLPQTAPSFKTAIKSVSNVVARLNRGATLRVVQGATGETPDKPYALSTSEPLNLELLAQNLVEVRITGGGFGKNAPTVELRRKPTSDPFASLDASSTSSGSGSPGAPAEASGSASDKSPSDAVQAPKPVPVETKLENKVFQSFQMMPQRDANDRPNASGDAEEATSYAISFAVSEPVEMFIPAISGSKPLALIKVRQLPIPKVKLSLTSELEDPWPDDQPLNLKIQVIAENPLQTVRLLIKSGQRTSKETVANVLAEDKLTLTTDYRLVLETYVESDLAAVEIVAEATDRALPAPLVGYSEPLTINTASAYGRYRATLQTLRELKQMVDDAQSKQGSSLSKEAQDLAKKAADQSEKSPFFDGLDRVQIHRFETKVGDIKAEADQEQLLELSSTLNDFLFEHEILDDRERDRDFFVAARSLSRLVEQEIDQRPVTLKVVTDRMRKYLNDRHERWQKRVERIAAEQRPAKWHDIATKKPFHEAMNQIDAQDAKAKTSIKAKSDQLTALSKAVVDYRAWIEELEQAEDKARESEEKQRQEGLASARDQMRELQKRQGEISAELDHAGDRSPSELENEWPATRMKQNANTKDTRRVESQLRSLSPQANQRIQAAIQAMEGTAENGNSNNFAMAETNSDLAGRLLRQAESAASQSQQKRRSRGRRRQVTGDNYYGQSVVGGDIEIKREYQVDRRYREDILQEVQNTAVDDENRVLLETYLREVIR